jgi:hypothetical protein
MSSGSPLARAHQNYDLPLPATTISDFTSPFLPPPPYLEPVHFPPVRGSSPRLSANFFDAMSNSASRRPSRNLPPVPSLSAHDPLQSVNLALENANRAIQDAQVAFEEARRYRSESEARLRTDSETPGQLVDLTAASSPPLPFSSSPHHPHSAESHFFSYTTHPHDPPGRHRSRHSVLDHPVFLPPRFSDDSAPPPRTRGLPLPMPGSSRPALDFLTTGRPRRLSEAAEEEAINRQRENHTNWQRTQARNRDRQRQQDLLNQQDQTPSSSPASSPTTMSPPSTQSSSRTSRRSRQTTSQPATRRDPSIDEVDLTEVHDEKGLSNTLARQREDAILAQNPGDASGRTLFTAYKCPVCLETPTDATATVCGHLFCHQCIVESLRHSVLQRNDGVQAGRKKGLCPKCRKPLELKDGPQDKGRTLVLLALKMVTRKRKRSHDEAVTKSSKIKQNSVVKGETLSSDDEDGNSFSQGAAQRRQTRKKVRDYTEDDDDLFGEFTNIDDV